MRPPHFVELRRLPMRAVLLGNGGLVCLPDERLDSAPAHAAIDKFTYPPTTAARSCSQPARRAVE